MFVVSCSEWYKFFWKRFCCLVIMVEKDNSLSNCFEFFYLLFTVYSCWSKTGAIFQDCNNLLHCLVRVPFNHRCCNKMFAHHLLNTFCCISRIKSSQGTRLPKESFCWFDFFLHWWCFVNMARHSFCNSYGGIWNCSCGIHPGIWLLSSIQVAEKHSIHWYSIVYNVFILSWLERNSFARCFYICLVDLFNGMASICTGWYFGKCLVMDKFVWLYWCCTIYDVWPVDWNQQICDTSPITEIVYHDNLLCCTGIYCNVSCQYK